MNLLEMEAIVAQRYAESVSSPIFFTSSDIRGALNEGWMVLGDLTEFREVEVPVKMLARQGYYDLRGYGVSPILTVFQVFMEGPVRWLRSISLADLDGDPQQMYYPRWEDITGQPKAFFMRSLYWMGTYPIVTADGDIAQVAVSCLPDRMEDDEDEPQDLLEEFHEALIEYALYVLHAQDRETTLALEHYARFVVFEERVREWVDTRQDLDRRVTAGEEADID